MACLHTPQLVLYDNSILMAVNCLQVMQLNCPEISCPKLRKSGSLLFDRSCEIFVGFIVQVVRSCSHKVLGGLNSNFFPESLAKGLSKDATTHNLHALNDGES
jgi:hypothetical protein